jgi:hypothetical protein
MKTLPTGRGMYVWVLARTEGGSLDKIIAKCHECNITWLAIKAGDQGNSWMPKFRGKLQFNAAIVDALHAAGIKVFGWSYDVPSTYKDKKGALIQRPGILDRQADVVKLVQDCGADGFIIDAEVEWNRAIDPDTEAAAYMRAIYKRIGLLTDFVVGDAPWPLVQYHPSFPFTAFGKSVDFRSPQVYWTAQKLDKDHEVAGPVDDSWERYRFAWDAYEVWVAKKRKPAAPQAAKPHLPTGSLFDDGKTLVQPYELTYFEENARLAGAQGVLYWVWESVPQRIWDHLRLAAPY